MQDHLQCAVASTVRPRTRASVSAFPHLLNGSLPNSAPNSLHSPPLAPTLSTRPHFPLSPTRPPPHHPLLQVLTFIIGVCFLGVSAYMAATFDAWQQYISWTGLIGCAVASLFVCALAILGCCGAIHRNTKILTLYLFFMFIITFITVALALVTLMYGTSICGGKPTEDVTCNANLESREVSNALIKIQTECCQAGSAMKGKGKGANETTHFADTVPMCSTKKNSNGTAVANALYTCMYPECDGSNEGDCVKYFTPCVLGIQKQYPGTKCDRKFPAPLGLTPDAMVGG